MDLGSFRGIDSTISSGSSGLLGFSLNPSSGKVKTVIPGPCSISEDPMTDTATLARRLQQALGAPELQLTIKQQDQHLMILIQRPEGMDLDYEALTDWFAAAIRSMPGLDVDSLSLYSRIQGQKQPDWQTQLRLTSDASSASEQPETQVQPLDSSDLDPPNPAESSNASAGLDLTGYCFIRNQLLLRTSLPTPPAEVYQHIQHFHRLSDPEKLQVLPAMTDFFKNPDMASLQGLSQEQRDWFEQMRGLNEQKFKTLSIWLSRYCADPEKALEQSQPPPPPPPPAAPSPDPAQSSGATSSYTAPRRGSRSYADPTPSPSQESPLLSVLCHLSAFLLPLIFPLIIYFIAADQVTKGNARSCLGLYLGQIVYGFLSSFLFFINIYLGLVSLVLLLLYGLIMPIVAAVVVGKNPGTVFKYPFMPF